MDLASAKAVITGGASGLGYASAERVIAAGGQVVLMDVNEEQGTARAAKLGDRAMFVRTDVSDEANVKAAIQSASGFMSGILSGFAAVGPSSSEIVMSPFRPLIVTGVISASNAPLAIAARARSTDSMAKAS